jgi:hypothetical protein
MKLPFVNSYYSERAWSHVDPYGVCDKRVKANSVLCASDRKWVHKRCSGVRGSLKFCGGCFSMHCRPMYTSAEWWLMLLRVWMMEGKESCEFCVFRRQVERWWEVSKGGDGKNTCRQTFFDDTQPLV